MNLRTVASPRPAFTLLEVLLAIALITVLAGGLLGFLSQLSDRRGRITQMASDLRAGGTLMERIEQDLVGAVATAPGVESGVLGTATTLRIATRGVWIDLSPGSAEDSGQPATVLARMADTDLQQSDYAFDGESGTLRGGRGPIGPGSAAVHVRGPEPISSRLLRVRFRYHDGTSWLDSFDSASAGGLPAAIEVALWFGEKPAAASPDAGGRTVRWSEPDRLRVIVVPDGPRAGQGGSL